MKNNLIVPKIILSNGFYPVHVRVSDASGSVDDTIITIHVQVQSGSSSASKSFTFGGANSGSSSSGSSSSGSGSGSSGSGSSGSGSGAGAGAGDANIDINVGNAANSFYTGNLDNIDLSNKNFDTLIGQYSLTTTTVSNIERDTYPIQLLPQGNDIAIPVDSQTISIHTFKAAKSVNPKSIITPDDVEIRAAELRVNSGFQAVANLVDMIRQAGANKETVELTIKRLEGKASDAGDVQTKIDEQILNIEASKRQLDSAILGVTAFINQLRNDLAVINADIDAAKIKINGINGQVNDAIHNRNNIASDVDAAQRDVNKMQAIVDAELAECADIHNQINILLTKRGDLEASIYDIEERLANSQALIDAKNARIAELIRLLAQARLDAAKLKQDHAELVAFSIAVPREIAQINRKIEALRAQCDLDGIQA